VPDEAQLLEIASAVADGSDIDWDRLTERSDEPPVVRELRVLADIVRAMRNQVPDAPAVMQSTGHERAAGDVAASDDLKDWGHLRVLEKLGGGSYGIVYRAWETRLQRDVALKLAKPVSLLREFDQARALQEARMLARVSHSNVVKVFGADCHDGRFGLWMELVDGRTLEEVLSSHGPMGAQEAAHVGIEVCQALAAVHQVGLLHRDVKASNVMRQKGGRILLMDFGAGRRQSKPDVKIIGMAGTPLYLAPELFAGDSPSTASDIYSLGVLIYHLVTGRYPIDATSVEAIERAHRRHELRPLRDARPDLPSAFVKVIERALSPATSERYQTAGAFGNALAAAVGAPDTKTEKETFVSRIAWWKLAAAGAVASVIVGLLATWIGQTPERVAAPATTAIESVPPRGDIPLTAADYEVEAAFYALRDDRRVRLANGSAVAPGDRLFLNLNVSQTAYVYVVNQDDKNDGFVLFPLPGQQLTNPVPVGQHQLPGSPGGVEHFWQVSSAGQREHFLLYVSPARLVEFESLLAAMPRAEPGRPVESAPLTPGAAGVLRSVGGLATAPSSKASAAPSLTSLPTLPDGRQTANGVWARQISFTNP
jgi:eukaryotic-like serine/threonine-protein kinase